MSLLVKSAWAYRGFVLSSVVNEYRSRLARSRFGTLWLVVHPLAQALVYAIVLANILAARIPGIDNKYAFAVYLLAGILCWSLFSEVINRCLTVFIDKAGLLKKIRFPRITLPMIAVGNALVSNFALALVILAILPFLGMYPSVHWLWLPILIAVTLMLATGIGVLLGVLNVFARDVGQITSVVLQFWFWLTPIVYPAQIVPESFRKAMVLNPVVPLVQSYQNILVFDRPPEYGLLGVLALSLILIGAALMLFRRASSEMVDVL